MDEWFEILETRRKKIKLDRALRMAKTLDISPYVYDPLGRYNRTSYWWCLSVLTTMRQEDAIYDFWPLVEAPDDQAIDTEAEPGVVF